MTEIKEYTPGTFCWVELATTDAAGAKKFYSELLGWENVDMPAGPDMVYTMAELEGRYVAGLYEQEEQQRSQGIPPHWQSYVSVASADESAAKAKSLGGTILAGPFDVLEAGRMAVVQDPTGAVVGLWQPGQHIGAGRVNQPGAFCWNELATRDSQKAGQFYTELFGWDSQTQPMGPTAYTVFLNNGQMNAGMMQMTAEWGDIPPHWMVYFAVDNVERDVERVKALGGQVLVPITEAADVGRFAVVQDPQGAAFSIIKLNNPG